MNHFLLNNIVVLLVCTSLVKIVNNKAVSWQEAKSNIEDFTSIFSAWRIYFSENLHDNDTNEVAEDSSKSIEETSEESSATEGEISTREKSTVLNVVNVTLNEQNKSKPIDTVLERETGRNFNKSDIISKLNHMFAELEENYEITRNEDNDEDDNHADINDQDDEKKSLDKKVFDKQIRKSSQSYPFYWFLQKFEKAAGVTRVYVNVTKDLEDISEVDNDGHDIHIHLPHRVLQKLTKSGKDQVIHIGLGWASELFHILMDT